MKFAYGLWIALIVLSLAMLIYSGYRLTVFEPYKQGITKINTIDSLQSDIQQIQPLVANFENGSSEAGQTLSNLVVQIETNWQSLDQTVLGDTATVQKTAADIESLMSLIRERVARERLFIVVEPFTDGIFNNLETMRATIAEEASSPFGGNEIQLMVVAIILLTISFIALGYMFNRESKSRLKESTDENALNQTAILRLLDELADLADGDLTISATVTEDFTGAIADSINFTIDQLRQLVSRINSTAVQVSRASQESRQTALHLAEASDHQAQEIAGASAAINEMAVTIDQVSSNAAESALVAGKSVSIANNGAKLVQNTIQGMDTIREQIQDTSKRIKRLGESSQEIGDIVSLINDIADQTNILALNAAIQASMAGDAGRGFAVVADEVQRLAERSAAATKQIETLVKTIQTDTNEAVISMEQTTTEVVNGARLAQDAGVALEEIEGVSVNLAELIRNISNAARQQASSAGHISNTMNVIQEITTQTSSGTSETAESIGELAKMATELRGSVSDFTLPADMVDEIATSSSPMSSEDLSAEDGDFLDTFESDDNDLGLEAELESLSDGFDEEKFNKSAL